MNLGYARRLHHPREFRRFFEGSEVFKLGECTVFRISNDLGYFRLGITLKSRGSSLDRNKVKRAIREQFRILAPILGSFDYNVVVSGTRSLSWPYPDRLARAIAMKMPGLLRKPAQ